MRSPLYSLVLIVSILLCSAVLWGDDKVDKVLAERDTTISKANEKAMKALELLLKSSKKEEDKLAVYKAILTVDPKHEEAIAKVAGAEPDTDLLGNPTNKMSMAKATLLAKNIDKMTAKDWDKLPGDAHTVSARELYDMNVRIKKGEVYLVVPNTEDKWSENTTSAIENYKGGVAPRSHRSLKSKVINAEGLGLEETYMAESLIIKVNTEGKLVFQMNGSNSTAVGSVRIKVYKIEK